MGAKGGNQCAGGLAGGARHEGSPRGRLRGEPLEFVIAPGKADDSKPPLRLNIARNGRMFEKNRMTLPNPQALNMTPWRERPRRLGKGRARGFAGRSAVMPSRSTASIQDAPIGLSADQGHARKTPLNRSKGRGASRRARQTRFCLFRMRGRSRLLRRV